MTSSPKDTHGPIVESSPSKGQNGLRNEDGRLRAKQSDAGTSKESQTSPSPNLARWFWGSIILMATLSILLSVAATLRQRAITETLPTSDEITAPTSDEVAAEEMSAGELDEKLTKANRAAVDAVMLKISPMLDDAYQPAYAAIPKYADYHYTVWGQYAELGAAALGSVGDKLQEIIFKGLDTQLDQVGIELDATFNETFQATLETETRNGATLGNVTKLAIDDAKSRMYVTAPIGATAAIGTGVAIKVAAKAMAKKIAAKLAFKAAAKTGGKWVAAGTGAGTGAALCSLSGPGAALCAAAGGLGAWIVADYGIVKLDEYWSRDDFEAELRKMVDQQKREHKDVLEKFLKSRALEVQNMSDAVVVQHDFTLRELSGIGNAEICRMAKALIDQYDPIRNSFSGRDPDTLQDLRNVATEYEGNLSLGPVAREILENLKGAGNIKITQASIKGNLPSEYRADRDVSGLLYINNFKIELPRIEATEEGGFLIEIEPNFNPAYSQSMEYAIALEQHLRIKSNRYFGAAGVMKIIEVSEQADGLDRLVKATAKISYDKEAQSVSEVSRKLMGIETVSLALALRVAPLPALEKVPEDCRKP